MIITHFYNKFGDTKRLACMFVMISLIVAISGCSQQVPSNNPTTIATTGQATTSESIEYSVPQQVAKLPVIDDKTINTYDGYKNFADNANYLMDILEDKTDFKIPNRFDTTVEGYKKVSKVLTEYAPLIDNYNKLVNSSRNVKPGDSASLQTFYISASIFGAESTIVYVAAFAGPSYDAVGAVYRASGLQSLAFKCGSCVAVVLSEAHWFIRTALVEGSSQTFEGIMSSLPKS